MLAADPSLVVAVVAVLVAVVVAVVAINSNLRNIWSARATPSLAWCRSLC